MPFIAIGHPAWVRAYLSGDSAAQVFIEERERPFAIFWEVSTTLNHEEFGSQYCLQYLESRLEAWDAWIFGREQFGDAVTFVIH